MCIRDRLKGAMAVFKRYVLSDTANQADLLLAITTESSDCALSVVEQPPLDGTKIALWAYLQTNVQTQVLHNGLFEVKPVSYTHLDVYKRQVGKNPRFLKYPLMMVFC